LLYLIPRNSSIETFTYAFRHFIEALHNQEGTKGSLLRLSVILIHESAELVAKSLTGSFRANYEELFKQVFSHALGKPSTPKSKHRTYFDVIHNSGGFSACSDYRECLMYALTSRMLELTQVRNSLYHEGGYTIGLKNTYRFLRDVFAYTVNLLGLRTLLEIAEELPPALKFCFFLCLSYFQEVETSFSHKGDLVGAWNAVDKRIREKVHEEGISFVERLFEGNKYAIERVNEVLEAIKPYRLHELIAILKDRVLTSSWYIKYHISPEDREQGIIRGVPYIDRQEEVKVTLDYWDGKTVTITMLHEGAELRTATESDKEELRKFLSSGKSFIVKTCIEKLPFKYIISAL